MKKRKTLFTLIILAIALITAFFLLQKGHRKDSSITLPETLAESDAGDNATNDGEFDPLSITPKTVQAAIAELSRPVSYQRTQTVEIFWTGGSAATAAQVAVSSGITRIDETLNDGSICHTLLYEKQSAVWYDDERTWITLRSDQYSSDALQRMPTYETVLDLPAESITHAEYCRKNGVYCIYVQTAPDENGYTESYWISVQSGLLFSAERTCNGQLIYRFSATEPGPEAPAESLFLLPNGSSFRE